MHRINLPVKFPSGAPVWSPCILSSSRPEHGQIPALCSARGLAMPCRIAIPGHLACLEALLRHRQGWLIVPLGSIYAGKVQRTIKKEKLAYLICRSSPARCLEPCPVCYLGLTGAGAGAFPGDTRQWLLAPPTPVVALDSQTGAQANLPGCLRGRYGSDNRPTSSFCCYI